MFTSVSFTLAKECAYNDNMTYMYVSSAENQKGAIAIDFVQQ